MTAAAPAAGGAVRQVAYFTMEIGLESDMPTYAGGLGVLAGDTVRAAADVGLPFLAVTLLHGAGYFEQKLSGEGQQSELPARWRPEQFLEPVDLRLKIRIESRSVTLRAWCYRARGLRGEVPVYFLDADLPENHRADRALTGQLYGGDRRYRLAQEAVLGLGGVQLVRALGHRTGVRLHLNEGHAALSILALVEEELARRGLPAERAAEVVADVQHSCVFTTHTPVPAGHDRFPADLVRQVLGEERHALLRRIVPETGLDMTLLAMAGACFVNGVALRHAAVTREMFPGATIHAVTNGVHTTTWTAPALARLFDRRITGWQRDPSLLHYALALPDDELRAARAEAKRDLLARVAEETGQSFDPEVLTIGFARRATAYKRAALIMHDRDVLAAIARDHGPIQFVFAGKAHPNDHPGKEIIAALHAAGRALGPDVRFVYLQNHDMNLGRRICAGVDVWLNTPRAPHEASGTSGMKAGLNGVPNLSVLDGWWVEGHLEGVTGWSIGEDHERDDGKDDRDPLDAASLYAKLADAVLPCYYRSPDRFAAMMRNSIARVGAFFSAQRMVGQYAELAYRLGLQECLEPQEQRSRRELPAPSPAMTGGS
jgi:glycogen phosphorylase